MNTISQRIRTLVEYYARGRQNEFAASVGVNYGTLNTMLLDANANPTYRVLRKILETYPDVSGDWLLKGEGDMFKPMLSDYLEAPSDEKYQMMEKEIRSLKDKIVKLLDFLPDPIPASLGKLVSNEYAYCAIAA